MDAGVPLPPEQCPRKETQHMGAIGEERRRLVIWARVLLDALSNAHPALDRARGHKGLMPPVRVPWQPVTAHLVHAWQSFSLSDKVLPHFLFLIAHIHGVVQILSWCNTAGELHPQRIWLGKLFINRKQTPVQPTKWSVKVYVLDLQ